MKKVAALTVCICFLLCSYHVDCKAVNISQFIIRTQETVDADTSDVIGNTLSSTVFCDLDAAYNGQGGLYSEQIISAINEFDFSILENFDYYYVGAVWRSGSGLNENWSVYVYAFNSDLSPFMLTTNYNDSHYPVYVFGSPMASGRVYECYFYSNSHGDWSGGETYALHDGNSTELNGYQYGGVGRYILDTNMPVYSGKQADNLRPQGSNLYEWLCNGGISQLDNVFANTSGYDAQGNIVNPSDPSSMPESNSNHMYFKNCDIGFCYPMGSITPASFGGAYFYVKYELDDWIVDHISEYTLDFYAEVEVGSDTIVTRRLSVPLEPDGCVVFPFSSSWITPLNSKGFSVLVTDNVIEDGYYKAFLYSVAASEFNNFGVKVSTYSGNNDIGAALTALSKGDIVGFLYYTHDSDVTIFTNANLSQNILAMKYNPFVIDAFTLLVSGNDQSGLVQKQFNLVTGSNVFTDTSGMQNQDPYDPPDSSDDTYLPSVPDGNNTTTPQVIINNGGTWSGSMNALITYDPAYRQLKEDLAADPNGNFTQYLAPFANNNAGGFVMGFLEGMPTALKTIFISGFGVLTLLGIYRFIRRG